MSNHWQPTASLSNLKKRAAILAKIRQFFADHDVLEVETPCLAQHTVSDPYLISIESVFPNQTEKKYYLQTSPEYHMKRLLAAGYGSIFQIGKSFRADEAGRLHNPEFTMLEWYRIGFTLNDLMDNVDQLLQRVLTVGKAERLSYQQIFQQHLKLDPLKIELTELKACAEKYKLNDPGCTTVDDWLMYLFSSLIEPKLQTLTFIHSFPASQAALATLNKDNPSVSDRVEVYYKGMELANGFYELTEVEQQRQRFIANNKQRQQMGLTEISLDDFFLQALEHGLPECSGIALGIDRLVMLATNTSSINEVICFPVTRA